MKHSETADLYRQLGLLLRSNLPLPDSLRQLAAGLNSQEFRDALLKVAEKTESGAPLSEAMRLSRHGFKPMHVRMIERGETSGTLPETLFEVARLAHADGQVVSMLRTVAAYPVFVVLFSAALFFFIYSLVIPEFGVMIADWEMGQSVPIVSRATYAVSRFLRANFPVFLAALLGAVFGAAWLFASRSGRATQLLLGMIKTVPFAAPVFRNLALSRVSSLWATLARHRTPVPEAFEIMADMAEDRAMSNALREVAARAAKGAPIAESLQQQSVLSPLLALTFRHTPEEDIPREMNALADIYRDRAALAIRKSVALWEAILIVGMSVWAGLSVIGIFAPLVALINAMTGY